MTDIQTLKTITINMQQDGSDFIFDVVQDDISTLTPEMRSALEKKLGGSTNALIEAAGTKGISRNNKKSPFDVIVSNPTYLVYIMNIPNWRFFGGGARNEPMTAKVSNDHSWEVWQNNFGDVDVLASDEKGMLAFGIKDTCADSSPNPYDCFFEFDIFARIYQGDLVTDIVIDPGVGNGEG
jgi:hypothetical protein